jgi:hypothetical protein
MGYFSHKCFTLQAPNDSENSTTRWQAIRDTPEPLASPPEGEALTGGEATSQASSRVEQVTALQSTALLRYIFTDSAVLLTLATW